MSGNCFRITGQRLSLVNHCQLERETGVTAEHGLAQITLIGTAPDCPSPLRPDCGATATGTTGMRLLIDWHKPLSWQLGLSNLSQLLALGLLDLVLGDLEQVFGTAMH